MYNVTLSKLGFKMKKLEKSLPKYIGGNGISLVLRRMGSSERFISGILKTVL